MAEQLFTKLLSSLTDPVNLILLLWIFWLLKEKGDLLEINERLLNAQQDRGVALAKIAYMIDILLKDTRRPE